MVCFDDEYARLLTSCDGHVIQFLDSVFGFLHRNTDFFKVTGDPQTHGPGALGPLGPGTRVGFPAGVARNLVMSAFKKWEEFQPLEVGREEEVATSDLTDEMKEVDIAQEHGILLII